MWRWVLALTALTSAVQAENFGPLISSSLGQGLEGQLHVVNKNTIQLRGFRVASPSGQIRIQAVDSTGAARDYEALYWRRKTKTGDEYLRPIRLREPYLPHRARALNLVVKWSENFQAFSTITFKEKAGNDLKGSVSIAASQIPSSAPLPVGGRFTNPAHIPYQVLGSSISLVDDRSFVITGFTFDGRRPPDGWIYGGQGSKPSRNAAAGVRLLMEGHDADASADGNNRHCAMTTLVKADSLKVTLPPEWNACQLGYLGVYCYQYGEDFGHTAINTPQDCSGVQPYLPPVRNGPMSLPSPNCAKKKARDGQGASAVDDWEYYG